jgi:hypothetical protein
VRLGDDVCESNVAAVKGLSEEEVGIDENGGNGQQDVAVYAESEDMTSNNKLGGDVRESQRVSEKRPKDVGVEEDSGSGGQGAANSVSFQFSLRADSPRTDTQQQIMEGGKEAEYRGTPSRSRDPQANLLDEDQDMEGDERRGTEETPSKPCDLQTGDLDGDQGAEGDEGGEPAETPSRSCDPQMEDLDEDQDMDGDEVGEMAETLSRSRDPQTEDLDGDQDAEGDEGGESVETPSRSRDPQTEDLDEDQDMDGDEGGEMAETLPRSRDPQPEDGDEDKDMEREEVVDILSTSHDSRTGDLDEDQDMEGDKGRKTKETPSRSRDLQAVLESRGRGRRSNHPRVSVVNPSPPRVTWSQNKPKKRKLPPVSLPSPRKKKKEEGLADRPSKGSSFDDPIDVDELFVSPKFFCLHACL